MSSVFFIWYHYVDNFQVITLIPDQYVSLPNNIFIWSNWHVKLNICMFEFIIFSPNCDSFQIFSPNVIHFKYSVVNISVLKLPPYPAAKIRDLGFILNTPFHVSTHPQKIKYQNLLILHLKHILNLTIFFTSLTLPRPGYHYLLYTSIKAP